MPRRGRQVKRPIPRIGGVIFPTLDCKTCSAERLVYVLITLTSYGVYVCSTHFYFNTASTSTCSTLPVKNPFFLKVFTGK